MSMTLEKAVRMLEAKAECNKRETSGTDSNCNNRECDECDLNYIQGNMDEQRETLYMAISALEKQIPKKVRITTSTKRCGNCGRQLSGIGNLHPKRNFCVECGQKICWEEE